MGGQEPTAKIAFGYIPIQNGFGSYVFLLDMRAYEGTSRNYRDATSQLTENGVQYSIENLGDIEAERPWVEAAEGPGIGESFVIEGCGSGNMHLLIMNGFLSAAKPYLYFQNGRVKTIKVEGLTSGIAGVCEVLDTPHPQTVDVSFIQMDEPLRITILDVYPGTKYQDTCLHYLITWDGEVIPFEDSANQN